MSNSHNPIIQYILAFDPEGPGAAQLTWGKSWVLARGMDAGAHPETLHHSSPSSVPDVRDSPHGKALHPDTAPHNQVPLSRSLRGWGLAWSSVSWLGFPPPYLPPHQWSEHWWQPQWQSWCTGWCWWASSHLWRWLWGNHVVKDWATELVSRMSDGRRNHWSYTFSSQSRHCYLHHLHRKKGSLAWSHEVGLASRPLPLLLFEGRWRANGEGSLLLGQLHVDMTVVRKNLEEKHRATARGSSVGNFHSCRSQTHMMKHLSYSCVTTHCWQGLHNWDHGTHQH